MEILCRFNNQNRIHILKLNSNFYRLYDAGLIQFEHLKSGLEARGLCQSKVDLYLFMKENLIVIIYIDDMLIFRNNKIIINKFIKSLEKAGKNNKNYLHLN